MNATRITKLDELTPAQQRRLRADIARSEVQPGTGCLNWGGKIDRNGYGFFRFKVEGGRRRMTGAHRAAFLLRHGAIGDLDVIDHLCRNRRCVNANHLEAVGPKENVLRGAVHVRSLRTGRHGRRPADLAGTCRNGHVYSEVGYVRAQGADGYTRTVCRACTREASARHRANRVAA